MVVGTCAPSMLQPSRQSTARRTGGSVAVTMTARARAIVAGAAVAGSILLAGPESADGGVVAAQAIVGTAVVVEYSGEVIGGVDIDAAVADLGDDHVTVVGESGAETDLAEAVSESRAEGLALSVVSVASSLTTQQAMDIAGAVQVQSGGTVLLLSPDAIGSRSNTVSTAADEDARTAAAEGADPPAAVRAYTDVATEKPFPWSILLIGAIILLIAAGIVGRIRVRHRRKPQDADALNDLTRGLAARLDELGPALEALEPRVEATGREDIVEHFTRAAHQHEELRQRLRVPATSRTQIDEMASELSRLDDRVQTITGQLELLAPPRPPRPPTS
jgi:hypothetical protein